MLILHRAGGIISPLPLSWMAQAKLMCPIELSEEKRGLISLMAGLRHWSHLSSLPVLSPSMVGVPGELGPVLGRETPKA